MAQEASKHNTASKLVKAYARDLRVAPRKVRLVTNLVKGMNVNDAMVQLQYTHKKAAPMVARLIKSAIANAKNNFSMEPEHLFIKSITADMGRAMKRYFPRARGSAFVIRRKLAHVNIVLEEKKAGKAQKSRLSLFKKSEERQLPDNLDHVEAVEKQEVKEPKHQFTVKTDEQRKTGKIQQKRRLFDRRGGE
ncbi:MAG: 50S ribosomal protein L22 [Candidatus Doudnabacteria bacterium]|nr:50S ribosomal protein L22 [Candidatus Doudnabacteria bacterium]